MSIEFIGLLSLSDGFESKPAKTKFDPAFVRDYAKVYEAAGFDRVLVAQTARCADSMVVAGQVAASTEKLKLMIAHRPGFIAPTMAARMLATLDQFSGGRVAVHIVTAASDAEIRNDGDFSIKEERYQRSQEYVQILRQIWESSVPFDHEGRFYRFVEGFSEAKPVQSPSIPVFWGGATGPGVEGGGACADVYAMGGGTVARTASLVKEVRAAAAPHGRSPEFCMSIRIILGSSEEEAWAKAYGILDAIVANQAQRGVVGADQGQEYHERRLAQALAYKGGSDKHLWTGLVEATKGRGNLMSLVGTPDQLCETALGYYDVGITRFLLTGFDPIPDALQIGRELLPRLRAGAQARKADLLWNEKKTVTALS